MAMVRLKTGNYLVTLTSGNVFEVENANSIEDATYSANEYLKTSGRFDIEQIESVVKIPSTIGIVDSKCFPRKNDKTLEDTLKVLKPKDDVLVYLGSFTSYGSDPDNVFTMRDHCGNHRQSNWVDAIKEGHLENIFIVEKMSSNLTSDGRNQYEIYLKNEKDDNTQKLAYLSNEIAVSNAFSRVIESDVEDMDRDM